MRITTVAVSLKVLLDGQFTFFQQQGFEMLAVSAEGKEIQSLEVQGIKHVTVPMKRTISPIMDFYCLLKLCLLIYRFKPDIVHTHTPKAGLLGMMAAFLCRVPVRMHTVAGMPLMEATGVRLRVLKLTELLTYACATKIYPNSTGLLRFIRQELIISKKWRKLIEPKVMIIGRGSTNGIDVHRYCLNAQLLREAAEVRNRYQIPSDARVFCFVGRIVRDKGMSELIEAFKQVEVQTKSVYLLVVGSFEHELDPLSAQELDFLNSNPQVILTGFQEDVRPFMVASDAFVFPSYREGLPNSVMQAACLELPCIVSDINGCNELIEKDRTGWVVPVKSAQQLQAAMEELISDYGAAKKKALMAREFVRKNYSREYIWQELLKEYRYQLHMHS